MKKPSGSLGELLDDAPATPDAWLGASEVVAHVLGDAHPLARHVEQLVESGLSSAERTRRRVNREREEEARVQRILEEEWPDYAERARMNADEAEARTPAPEKAWALRNVAR